MDEPASPLDLVKGAEHLRSQSAAPVSVFLALAVVGLLGALLLAYVTPHGLGLAHDSADYIASARNISAGMGVGRMTCVSFKPMVLWPPLYPALLALID